MPTLCPPQIPLHQPTPHTLTHPRISLRYPLRPPQPPHLLNHLINPTIINHQKIHTTPHHTPHTTKTTPPSKRAINSLAYHAPQKKTIKKRRRPYHKGKRLSGKDKPPTSKRRHRRCPVEMGGREGNHPMSKRILPLTPPPLNTKKNTTHVFISFQTDHLHS